MSSVMTVDKFLGLNQSPNGSTELKPGEAAVAENWYITDDQNLKTRPGTVVKHRLSENQVKILHFWQGMVRNKHCVVIVKEYSLSSGVVFVTVAIPGEDGTWEYSDIATFLSPSYPLKIFTIGDKVYVIGKAPANARETAMYELAEREGRISLAKAEVYVPLFLSGCSPSGGGTEQERLNTATNNFRVQFSADGTAKEYTLPQTAFDIVSVTVDGENAGGDTPWDNYDYTNHVYTFSTPPVKGVNNVEFVCRTNGSGLNEAWEKFLNMRFCEAYNGATDTRIFFYGDGTNTCYYSDTPAFGVGLYIPAGNEIAVDSSASPLTGMRRHYTRLMAFKPDGAFTINYEPVTLADGRVIAGFYVRPASRSVGNDMDGQIQTVNNYPRTLCAGALYEWRHSAAYYQDERYSKRISQKIERTLSMADHQKIVTCDDNASHTYYMFLNDDKGTVLVNRYDLDAWTIYTGEIFRNIRFADGYHGNLLFCNDTAVFAFDPKRVYDVSTEEGGKDVPISCLYETGYQAFGADYRRKYSSYIWVSVLPEVGSRMEITASTDRREDYLVKVAGRPLFGFNNIDFSNFSFLLSRTPKMQRVKIKVKKFVYYKLIFRVNHPGTRATVLGYDQQIRYSSNVK